VTAPTPLERLEQALAELGALTPDGIADRMRALGIKGELGRPRCCPIALYLRAVPGIAWVSVIPTRVTFVLAPVSPFGRVPAPGSVYLFVKRFDRGVYLDLVAVDGGADDE
jgi:hypothetical protein